MNIRIFFTLTLLVLGANYVMAVSTWRDPVANPPGGNAEAPLNVSDVSQDKEGSLSIKDAFAVFGKSLFQNTVTIQDGTEKTNRVLASFDDAGAAQWKEISDVLNDAGIDGGGGSGSGLPFGNMQVFDESGTFTVP
ncbi:MAG: hypothetical protein Q8P93_02270, partial [bacterium]|nr:hypothetical protein [bacterium]